VCLVSKQVAGDSKAAELSFIYSSSSTYLNGTFYPKMHALLAHWLLQCKPIEI
jgi:hypothetical protein